METNIKQIKKQKNKKWGKITLITALSATVLSLIIYRLAWQFIGKSDDGLGGIVVLFFIMPVIVMQFAIVAFILGRQFSEEQKSAHGLLTASIVVFIVFINMFVSLYIYVYTEKAIINKIQEIKYKLIYNKAIKTNNANLCLKLPYSEWRGLKTKSECLSQIPISPIITQPCQEAASSLDCEKCIRKLAVLFEKVEICNTLGRNLCNTTNQGKSDWTAIDAENACIDNFVREMYSSN